MKRFRQAEYWEAEKIKGSRFVVMTCPVRSFKDVQQVLSSVQLSHPNANHNCWAYRLSNGDERCSDDGEPGGSAGSPILQRLIHADVVDSLAVVTRYFGGTKLGVGGLIRAYGRSVSEAMLNVSMDELISLDQWGICCSYEEQSTLRGVVHQFNGVFKRELYREDVEWTILINPDSSKGFEQRCIEVTSGRVEPSYIGAIVIPNQV